MDYEKLVGFDPEKLIKRQGEDQVTRDDFKQDPATGRYIIPYTLTDTSMFPQYISGEPQHLHTKQHRALMEVMNEIQQRVNVQFKEVSGVSVTDKGDKVIQFVQGDISFEGKPFDFTSFNEAFMSLAQVGNKLGGPGHVGGCVCDDCRRVILDNDKVSQWESMRAGYWEKGRTGWRHMAHETLHALGLKDAVKISPLITQDQTIMSYTPGTIKGSTIREGDFAALQMIFGEAPKEHPARAADLGTTFTPAPAPTNTTLVKPFVPFEIIAAMGLGVAAAYTALEYGARKTWSAVTGVAAAALAIVGIKAYQSYRRGPIEPQESNQPVSQKPAEVVDRDFSSLPNPLPDAAPTLAASRSNPPIR